jgi:hypothetical protein
MCVCVDVYDVCEMMSWWRLVAAASAPGREARVVYYCAGLRSSLLLTNVGCPQFSNLEQYKEI